MKRILITTILIYLSVNLFGQLFKPDKNGQDLFIQGTNFLKSGKYEIADSLFSLSLCTYKNANVYYNRGISRLYMQDTLGFCQDLGIASSKYLDSYSISLFNSICCTNVDTFYYDRKMKVSTKELFKYYEVIQQLKYEKEIIGKFHDVNANNILPYLDFGCDQDILNIGLKPTDIIGMYNLIDSVKYYYYTDKTPVLEIENTTKYNNLKQYISNFFNSKYGELKINNNLEQITIYFEVYFSSIGEVSYVNFLGTVPLINFYDKEKEFIKDIENITKNYPKVTPARFLKTKVGSVIIDFVNY